MIIGGLAIRTESLATQSLWIAQKLLHFTEITKKNKGGFEN